MTLTDVPDPFPLRTIPVPPEVTRVDGCDCGGVEWHRSAGWSNPGCSIWNMPEAERMSAVIAAQDRQKAFTAALNVKLHARML